MSYNGWLYTVSVFKSNGSKGLHIDSERVFEDDEEARSFAEVTSKEDGVVSTVISGVASYVEYQNGKRVY